MSGPAATQAAIGAGYGEYTASRMGSALAMR
ncbi:hypothetical protein [Burkholderia singularis]